jgi:hypothetical protein
MQNVFCTSTTGDSKNRPERGLQAGSSLRLGLEARSWYERAKLTDAVGVGGAEAGAQPWASL